MRVLDKMGRIAVWRKPTKKIRSAALALLVGGAFVGGWGDFRLAAEESASDDGRTLEVVAKGKDSCFALLVGVDKYDDLKPLAYAGSDAKALRDALLEIGFPEENVWILTSDGSRSERPTKENIEDALDEILAESGPNATVFVALSGHGYETKGGVASFCPKDVEVEKIDGETYVTKDSSITIDDVTSLLRKDDAKFKMLIVDACRETASTKSAGGGAARAFSEPDASGIAFLQSCRSSQLSCEDAEFKRGIFTHYFIEGLRGAAGRGDGGASFLDVCGYAASKTKERAREAHKATQTPFYEFAGSDFWLKEPSGTPSDGSAAATASSFFTEAFQAFSAKDYATARAKCEAYLAASRTEAEKAAARNLLAMIAQAENPRPSGTQTAAESNASGDWFEQYGAGTLKSLEADGITYNFRYCPSGTFAMGSPENEIGRSADETQRQASLDGFWLLETEVTVGMRRSFAEATGYRDNNRGGRGRESPYGYGQNLSFDWENPGVGPDFQQTDARPVTQVGYAGAVAFCEWLAKKTGAPIRLPSGNDERLFFRFGLEEFNAIREQGGRFG